MKFQEKYQIVRESHVILESQPANEKIMLELQDYEFDGIVDVVDCPTFYFDTKYNIVLNPTEKKDEHEQQIFLKKDGELHKLGENTKFMQVSTCQLGKSFGLQDFFDKNKDAECIVFYTPEDSGGYTVFHAGNQLRVCVFKNKEIVK